MDNELGIYAGHFIQVPGKNVYVLQKEQQYLYLFPVIHACTYLKIPVSIWKNSNLQYLLGHVRPRFPSGLL